MKTTQIRTEEAPTKWWAARDARMRNLANKSRYPEAIHRQIDRMIMVMDLVYAAKKVHEAYGKKGVSIKVDGAVIKDKTNLRALEAEWAGRGFTKKISPQGVIYRLTA